MPIVPLGSSVTRAEFCNPTPRSRTATTAPFVPSRTSAPFVEATTTSWWPWPRSAVTIPPWTAPTDRLQITEPSAASSAYTVPPPGPPSVPSSTARAPLPRTSARAGLDSVMPSRAACQTRPQWVSKASTLSVSEPWKVVPVPTTMPVAPPARKAPTAGDDSTPTSGLASQSSPPVGLSVPSLPVGAKTRTWPPWV